MVVLGFRPKSASAGMPSPSLSISQTSHNNNNKKDNEKENAVNFRLDAGNNEMKKSLYSEPKKNLSKPSYFAQNPKQKQQVSSNWKRLKSMKVGMTSLSSSSSSSSFLVKKISDSEWFGVKNVQEFAAGSEDQILRENVPTATLFPPSPPGLSPEKLKQPCKFVALDCEMVGTGLRGYESILARVSVVNFHGIVLLDAYIKPTRKISDYRTAVSGITPGHLIPSKENVKLNSFGQILLSLPELQELLVPLLQNRIVVGHALNNDFSALLLSSNHPRKFIRDTSRYAPFRALSNGRSPALKMLAARILGVKIQGSSHDSVDDARIAMLLYRAVKNQWENLIFTHADRKIKKETDPKNKNNKRPGKSSESECEAVDDNINIFNSILQ